MQVYDKNGQPYDADLVDGETYRAVVAAEGFLWCRMCLVGRMAHSAISEMQTYGYDCEDVMKTIRATADAAVKDAEVKMAERKGK